MANEFQNRDNITNDEFQNKDNTPNDVFNFREIAQYNTLLSKLMLDRAKLETKDVVGRVLTIIGFDFAPKFDKNGDPIINETTGEVDTFGVVIFEEEPNKYYSVGTVFTKVCKAWAGGFGGDAEEASAALVEQGGVKVRFSEGKTKKGHNLVNVEVL